MERAPAEGAGAEAGGAAVEGAGTMLEVSIVGRVCVCVAVATPHWRP